MTVKVARTWIAKSRVALLTACAGTFSAQTASKSEDDLFSADQGEGIGEQLAAAAQRQLPILHDRSIETYVGPPNTRMALGTLGEFALARLDARGPELRIALIKVEPFVVEEVVPALPFPVRGLQHNVVGSYFGAPRDAGARHHEGVDIFAPRLTPVVAVVDGRATPRVSERGGNTVWLSTHGTSYYYAHLERAVVKPRQRVRAGQVLGYVGNTGNALAAPPHLHFGIYRWGKGAVDPLPQLAAGRFETPAEAAF